MTSQIGYLKLLISRSILSGTLDFEIERVTCILLTVQEHGQETKSVVPVICVNVTCKFDSKLY